MFFSANINELPPALAGGILGVKEIGFSQKKFFWLKPI